MYTNKGGKETKKTQQTTTKNKLQEKWLVNIEGGSNMTGTDLCVNKPNCAAAVRPWESEATTSTFPFDRVKTFSVLSGSCWSDERTEGN